MIGLGSETLAIFIRGLLAFGLPTAKRCDVEAAGSGDQPRARKKSVFPGVFALVHWLFTLVLVVGISSIPLERTWDINISKGRRIVLAVRLIMANSCGQRLFLQAF